MSTSISSRRSGFLHAQRELRDAQVLVAEVEDLAAHRGVLRLDQGDVRLGGVPDVHERAPHLPAVVERQPALGERVPDEGVDHEVVAHPGRVSVDRALAQRDRAERGVGHRQDLALRLVLREGVGRARRDRRGLVLEHVRPLVHDAAVVDRARGGEDVAAHPAGLAEPRERGRRHGVHLVVGARVVLRGRIVRQAAHVDDGVDPVQHRWATPRACPPRPARSGRARCGVPRRRRRSGRGRAPCSRAAGAPRSGPSRRSPRRRRPGLAARYRPFTVQTSPNASGGIRISSGFLWL